MEVTRTYVAGVVISAFTPEQTDPLRGMDERALGIRLRVYERIGTLMLDADATESMPRSCIPGRAEDAGTCTY